MLIAGILLSLISGLANSGAAFLEKHQMLVGDVSERRGIRLLSALLRRPLWMLAMLLSVLAWLSETAALGLAPVAVVTTLRSAGRGGLVVAGHRWLGERFGRLELAGVAMLVAGGVLTSLSVATSHAPPPLSNVVELLLAAVSAVVAICLVRTRHAIGLAAATGVLFVGTGVFGKEIGDRVVRDGAAALPALMATPGPWLTVILGASGIIVLQRAFTRSNAASVSAITMTISADGLIAASVVLYHQPLARAGAALPLLLGIVISTLGGIAVAAGQVEDPAQTPDAASDQPQSTVRSSSL